MGERRPARQNRGDFDNRRERRDDRDDFGDDSPEYALLRDKHREFERTFGRREREKRFGNDRSFGNDRGGRRDGGDRRHGDERKGDGFRQGGGFRQGSGFRQGGRSFNDKDRRDNNRKPFDRKFRKE